MELGESNALKQASEDSSLSKDSDQPERRQRAETGARCADDRKGMDPV